MTETTLATPGERADYDVLKAEVHRKAMEEIAMEMGITLVRTSGSPVVTEAKDLSCSVLDDKVEQIGFSSYVGLHISTSFLGIRALLENYDLDDVAPGDAFIVNDPHTSGALHEGDVGVIMPYYYDGELVAWGYVNEHTIDVGGSGVSGFAASARDCFSEGLRFPALRFMREGTISPEWRMFLGNNVRAPSAVLNDLRSMVAAVNTGDRRLRALIDRMGLEQHREFCEINKGLSERIVRQRIEALPDGRYQSTDWVEYDGLGEPLLLEVSCTMDVAGDELKLSFRGESQIAGPINGAPPAVLGQSMNTLQCVLLHDVPANAGLWRPIEFDLGPTGTVVNSVPPAPVCFAHVGTGMRIDKLVRDVLAQAASLSAEASVRLARVEPALRGHLPHHAGGRRSPQRPADRGLPGGAHRRPRRAGADDGRRPGHLLEHVQPRHRHGRRRGRRVELAGPDPLAPHSALERRRRHDARRQRDDDRASRSTAPTR